MKLTRLTCVQLYDTTKGKVVCSCVRYKIIYTLQVQERNERERPSTRGGERERERGREGGREREREGERAGGAKSTLNFCGLHHSGSEPFDHYNKQFIDDNIIIFVVHSARKYPDGKFEGPVEAKRWGEILKKLNGHIRYKRSKKKTKQSVCSSNVMLYEACKVFYTAE